MILQRIKRALGRPNPARELALIGSAKRRQSVRETAAQIRRELGMPEHPALKAHRTLEAS